MNTTNEIKTVVSFSGNGLRGSNMYQVKLDTIPHKDWFRNQPIEWRNRMFEIRVEHEAYAQYQEQRAAKLEILNLQVARYMREHGIV